ncbi:hypothetical protein C0991_009250 [Blastosporella zonata]|nr:hypothetical protein C0991_009250 [Blastosporella zonata]
MSEHYQAFAASLPHQSALLGHLGETQTQIYSSRTALLEAKEALGNKRADLVQLWSRGQTLEEMLRLLDQIEHLKSVPDLLETLMSEKRLLQAAVLLVRSLKIINKPDMLEIGAVSDLRSYLVGQEMIEFEEEGSFKPFENTESTPTSPTFRPSRQARFLMDLAIKPNESPVDLSDLSAGNNQPSSNLASVSSATTHNPEADSFAYMETLIESLAVLGKLGSALDNVAQRLPSEIFNLVETTLDEVEERAEYGRRSTMLGMGETVGRMEGVYLFTSDNSPANSVMPAKGTFLRASCLRLAALESSSKRVEHEILKDLFWTLYSNDRFQDLVATQDTPESKLEAKPALAAQWAQRSEVNTCISELLGTKVCLFSLTIVILIIFQEEDGAKLLQLCRQETNLELELLSGKAITQPDLIFSVRNLASLAALYRSVVSPSTFRPTT